MARKIQEAKKIEEDRGNKIREEGRHLKSIMRSVFATGERGMRYLIVCLGIGHYMMATIKDLS